MNRRFIIPLIVLLGITAVLLFTCTENPIILSLESPEIRITYLGNPVSSDSDNPLVLGDVELGSIHVYEFRVENTSKTSDLSLTGTPVAVLGGSFTALFSIEELPPSLLEPGQSGILSIQFAPLQADTGAGVKSADITIESDDEDESSFSFSISIDVNSISGGPEISLREGLTLIESGGTYDFGSVHIDDTGVTKLFAIENYGDQDLRLFGNPIVAISGTDESLFSLESQPVDPVLSLSGTQFSILFTPETTGEKTATVTFYTNDDDEDTFTFTITGTGSDQDLTPPDVTVSTTAESTTSLNPIPVTVTFTEEVVGFDSGDLTVTGGTAGGFDNTQNPLFTFEITPEAGQDTVNITVRVPEGAASDAGGNPNDESNTLEITYDGTVPSDTTPPVWGGDGAISFSAVEQTTLTVSWSKASDTDTVQSALEYKVVMSTAGDIDTLESADIVADTGSKTLITDWTADLSTKDVTGLDADNAYFFNVIVRDGAGNRTLYVMASRTTAAVADTVAPDPGNGNSVLTLNGETDSSIDVGWIAASDDATVPADLEYILYYSDSAGDLGSYSIAQSFAEAYGTWTPGLLSETVDGLAPEQTYWINVFVRDQGGNDAAYTAASAVTLTDTTPPDPGGGGALSFTEIGPSYLTVNWATASDNAAETGLEYKVVMSISPDISTVADCDITVTGGGKTLLQDWTADLSTKSVTGLQVGTSYAFNVLVRDQQGNRDVYTMSFQSTAEAVSEPDPPSGLIVVYGSEENSLELTWTDNSDDETEFEIWYDVDGAGYVKITETVPYDTTTYTHTGLDGGSTYTYYVIARNDIGPSGQSNTDSETIPGGRIVAVGDQGLIMYSDTMGESWTHATKVTPTTSPFYCVAGDGEGTWVAGTGGEVLYASTDNGETWDQVVWTPLNAGRTFTTIGHYYDGTYHHWVAATDNNNGTTRIYSSDGLNWTASTSNLDYSPVETSCYDEDSGRWIMSSGGTGASYISTNHGVDWSAGTSIGSAGGNLADDGLGTIVAAYAVKSTSESHISFSTDGGNIWTPAQVTPEYVGIFDVAYGDGTWVTVGVAGFAACAFYSNDADTWTGTTPPSPPGGSDMYAVVYDSVSGYFVAGGYGGHIMSSSDGGTTFDFTQQSTIATTHWILAMAVGE